MKVPSSRDNSTPPPLPPSLHPRERNIENVASGYVSIYTYHSGNFNEPFEGF